MADGAFLLLHGSTPVGRCEVWRNCRELLRWQEGIDTAVLLSAPDARIAARHPLHSRRTGRSEVLRRVSQLPTVVVSTWSLFPRKREGHEKSRGRKAELVTSFSTLRVRSFPSACDAIQSLTALHHAAP